MKRAKKMGFEETKLCVCVNDEKLKFHEGQKEDEKSETRWQKDRLAWGTDGARKIWREEKRPDHIEMRSTFYETQNMTEQPSEEGKRRGAEKQLFESIKDFTEEIEKEEAKDVSFGAKMGHGGKKLESSTWWTNFDKFKRDDHCNIKETDLRMMQGATYNIWNFW